MPNSQIVHEAEYYRDGNAVLAYQALAPVACCRCGKDIKPGELFSRSAGRDGKRMGIRYTFCRQCMPFERKPED